MKNFVSIMLACIMLISAVVPVFATDTGIKMHLNGNDISSDGREISVNNGIFSATTSGGGLFALAFYKNQELVSVQFAEGKSLSDARLNMVVDSDSYGYDFIKIFRFDEDGKPVDTYNKILKPTQKEEDLRIYVNHTFDDETLYDTASNKLVKDGHLELIAYYSDATSKSNPRFDFMAPNLEKYVVYEADYKLGELCGKLPGESQDIRLFCSTYNNGVKKDDTYVIIRLRGTGIFVKNENNTKYSLGNLSADKWTKISVVMNMEQNTFDVYVDRKKTAKINQEDVVPSTEFNHDIAKYGNRGFFIGHVSDDGSARNQRRCHLLVDNIQVYGIDSIDNDYPFIDIENKISNVHKTLFSDVNSIWETDIYERPTAAEIAKKTIEKGHPRVILNADKVERIKTSDDEKIKAWREIVVDKADMALIKPPMSNEDYNPKDSSLDDVPVALETVMNLGLAYQISDDAAKKKDYANKAYEWAEVLMNFKSVHEDVFVGYDASGNKVYEDRNIEYDWNSDSYLDVGEISTIMSICYDWMYDAWDETQKQEFVKSIMRSSIDISYKTYFDQPIKNGGKTKTTWWDSTNNWNAVCNGGVLVAALAFMEEDIYRCSRLAEGTIRGFEYLLPKFAPAGAWAEGTGYWAYTLKYLTIACSTLENCCGSLYGIDKTPGLENSQTYSLDLEGATQTFGFGDVGGGEHTKASFMYYWAEKYKNSAIGAAALCAMRDFSFRPDVFDLVYYNPAYAYEGASRSLSAYYEGTEVVKFSSSNDNDATSIAISGGEGVATSHDHLDSGSIIVDMNGVRIIGDTGAEHYRAIQYFDTNRYWYYKARPEGHNIFVINPQNLKDESGAYYHGQAKNALSTVENYNPEKKEATMDLTQAYARDASSAKRTISLDNKKVIVNDEIVIRSDGDNRIEWYYHFADILSYTKSNGKTAYINGTEYCEISSDADGIIITYKYKSNPDVGSPIRLDSPKKFRISFKSDSGTEFRFYTKDAVRNAYDEDVVNSLRTKAEPQLSDDYYTYGTKNDGDHLMDKIVVEMLNVPSKTKIKLTTTIEAIE